jgi:hypothetical protein
LISADTSAVVGVCPVPCIGVAARVAACAASPWLTLARPVIVALCPRALRASPAAALVVWAFILAGFMVWDLHSTSRTAIWAIFAGWCIGVLGASIAQKIYR